MNNIARLPTEIQYQIIGLCLQNWTAKLEQHTKPRYDDNKKLKSTLRIWSSKVYDALMISLTCKDFHAVVQHIQKDPSLFDGRIDFIQEPGALVYFSDSYRAQHPYNDPNETPNVMYKTRVFIKNSPYVSSTKEERTMERYQYHAGVRAWLANHITRLDVMFDELDLTLGVDITHFPLLRNLTLYRPDDEVDVEYMLDYETSSTLFCEVAHDEQKLLRYLDTWLRDWCGYDHLEYFFKKRISITYVWDVKHLHYEADGSTVSSDSWDNNLRLEYLVSRDSRRIKSLYCLHEYARPGYVVRGKKIELVREKVDK